MIIAQALHVNPFTIQKEWTYAQLYLICQCLREQAESQERMMDDARQNKGQQHIDRAIARPTAIPRPASTPYPKEKLRSYWYGD